MRKCIYLFLTLYLISTIISSATFAQANPVDSSLQKNAFNNAVTFYYTSLGEQSPIYNGPEYYFYDPTIKGNAYFLNINGFVSGSVYYDGALYNGVPMLYDLYGDKVVVLLYNHYSKFSLIKERVKSFDYLDHHFLNINTDTISNTANMKPGFYDELYKGKLQVLVRRSKDIQTNTSGTLGPENYFNLITKFFLKKNNTYYSVTSQGSLIDILKDRKKELQQYIRANQIKFRKDPDEAMVKIASYYDHLTN
jgi:hypothetical protein